MSPAFPTPVRLTPPPLPPAPVDLVDIIPQWFDTRVPVSPFISLLCDSVFDVAVVLAACVVAYVVASVIGGCSLCMSSVRWCRWFSVAVVFAVCVSVAVLVYVFPLLPTGIICSVLVCRNSCLYVVFFFVVFILLSLVVVFVVSCHDSLAVMMSLLCLGMRERLGNR